MGVVKITGSPTSPSVASQAAADDPTRDRILELLLTKGALTASELGEQLALTATGIRRHLGNLADSGLIDQAEEPAGPRGRGRPAKLYRLTAAGRQRFGDQYDDLALSALAELVAALGPDALDRLAAKRLSEVEDDYLARRAADPDADPLDQLAAALSVAGYFASSQGAGELCLHHCPVAHVAAQYPQLCEAETEIFARLLGTDVSRSATIALGDAACRTHLGGPAVVPGGATMLPDPVSPSADRKVSA